MSQRVGLGTELTYLDFTGFAQMAGEYYSDVEFKVGTELPKKSPKAVLAVLKENDEEYSVNVSVAKKSKIDTDELSDMGDMLAVYVEQLRTIDAVMKSNEGEATEEQVMTALMPVEVSHITEGDKDAGLGAELIQMFGPLIIVFVLYIMIILYGQTIGNIVISEKVSKLMETLLVTVKPVELIAGKIIAIVSIAVLQISMWVIGIVSGIFIGDVVASNMNPGYSNVVFNAVDLIREAGKDLAFSAPVIILSVLALIVGFAFYCIVAGMISSVASKAEELASANAVFQMFVIVSFLLSYMLPLQGLDSEVISIILHAVPFTGAFMIPGSMLLGNVSLLVGIGYLALLIVFTVAVAYELTAEPP